MRRAAVVMVLLVALVHPAWGQDPEKKPPSPSAPELDVPKVPVAPTGAMPSSVVDLLPGDRTPDFQLDSSLGGAVRAAQLKGHWCVLVFDESRARLAALRTVQDSLWAIGVQPYGFCRDGIGALRTMAEREQVTFPILSDVTGQISQLFNM